MIRTDVQLAVILALNVPHETLAAVEMPGTDSNPVAVQATSPKWSAL